MSKKETIDKIYKVDYKKADEDIRKINLTYFHLFQVMDSNKWYIQIYNN